MNQLSEIKTLNSRRRRIKIRGLKYTCQNNKSDVTISGGDGGNERKRDDLCGEEKKAGEIFGAKASDDGGSKEISISLTSPRNDVVLEDEAVLSYGSVSVIGGRKEMEDTVKVELGFLSFNEGEEKYDFFGVYDGHGGALVAEACKERLHRVIVEEIMEGKEGGGGVEYWEKVMEECFRKMDEEVVKDKMMGSTAVVAVVGKEEVVVANCGDSRAVICRGGVAVPLSVDHKPDRPDELERVEAAGGRVINWNGHRVLGVLATSRSIGDQYLKPFVSSKPEVTVNKRAENDEFLVLASDGLWDVISNEFACQIIKRCLHGRMRRKSQGVVSESRRTAEAAAVLAELAMARGSKDNISVIVVELKRRHRVSC
ncbi:PHOSPHATASE 2C FAMILY PROTEIN [Salix purpurea]|uniref:protein-serine/threonine phosphatase n=1 Tax=Salix purpurea TaxID=77065 RepID=A0A9Q0ZW71_SALPP|nr:PHOSPHATASE 2C FAMILY PROTEIN [Salix purpurea]